MMPHSQNGAHDFDHRFWNQQIALKFLRNLPDWMSQRREELVAAVEGTMLGQAPYPLGGKGRFVFRVKSYHRHVFLSHANNIKVETGYSVELEWVTTG